MEAEVLQEMKRYFLMCVAASAVLGWLCGWLDSVNKER